MAQPPGRGIPTRSTFLSAAELRAFSIDFGQSTQGGAPTGVALCLRKGSDRRFVVGKAMEDLQVAGSNSSVQGPREDHPAIARLKEFKA